MRQAVVRDNLRKFKVNPHQTKNVQSQSPPHKKLLKKIESTHQAASKKYEISLQDNYLHPEQKEEAQDFRVEIERRYQKSISNKIYAFPLYTESEESDNDNDSDSSLNSLKHVTVYDLLSQNQRIKSARRIQKSNTIDLQGTYRPAGEQQSNTQREFAEYQNASWRLDTEEEDALPIELRIRDKSSVTYRQIIRLLENTAMLSHNSTNSHNRLPEKKLAYDAEHVMQTEYSDTTEHAKPYLNGDFQSGKQADITNFTTQASTSEAQKNHPNQLFQQTEKSRIGERNLKSAQRHLKQQYQNVKKTQSQEKVQRKTDSSSFLEKSTDNYLAGNSSGKG